jgi:phospholipase/carboxylesterase
MEHGMASFVRRLAKGAVDQDDLELHTDELAIFVDAAAQAYAFPKERLVAVGVSSGANIATSFVVRYPKKAAGAVLMRGTLPFRPTPGLDLERKPVLLLGGLDDPIAQTDEAEELANMFRAANADVTAHWEKIGHTLAQGDVLMAFDWLRRFYDVPRVMPAR